MKKVITKIDLNNKIYGGRIYENQIVELLSDEIEFKRVFLLKYDIKILNVFRILFIYIKYHFFHRGTLLLTNQTTWLAGFRATNIVVVHHIDSNYSKRLSGNYQKFCDKILFRNKRIYSQVVTVARCWKTELESLGFDNVHVIYNSFDPSEYKFSEEEISDFKEKYSLTSKPIVYLGNCQKKKGVVESYNALKEIDAHFVTSGLKDVELPVTNLILPFRDYKCLLASADIVLTMSLFKEGWNRVAHEAVLAGTPVIGSGQGGMKELLTLSNQTICVSFDSLLDEVKDVLSREEQGDIGELEKYDLHYFKAEWSNILHKNQSYCSNNKN